MVTKEEVAGLEKAFDVRLPADYVAFILNYPERLKALKKDSGWKQESPAHRELLSDPKALQKINELVRSPNTPWTAEDPEAGFQDDGPWPAHYFVIGDDPTGNYWCLNTKSTGTQVLFYDHDFGTFQKQADSVEQFAAWLVETIEKWNQRQAKKGPRTT